MVVRASAVEARDFTLITLLGTGAYGRVILTQKKGGLDNGQTYALKAIRKSDVVGKPRSVANMMSERLVLERVRGQAFLAQMTYAFQDPGHLYLAMDFVCGGELFTYLHRNECLTELEARFYIAEITQALETLHVNDIIYRDIKLENILIDAEGHVILTDFGLSKMFSRKEKFKYAYGYCGTIEYMSPEIVTNGGARGHSFATDWWSLGVLSYELMTGTTPFATEEDTDEAKHERIQDRIRNAEVSYPYGLSDLAVSLLRGFLTRSPHDRLGSGGPQQVKQHPFFKSLDWDDVQEKRVDPPFVPSMAGKFDTSNFSTDFTNLSATLDENSQPDFSRKFQKYDYRPEPETCAVKLRENELRSSQLKKLAQKQRLSKSHEFFSRYRINLNEAMAGDGVPSACMRCSEIATGKQYTVKLSDRSNSTASGESTCLNTLKSHPNIVDAKDCFVDSDFSYLITEDIGHGNLLDQLKRNMYSTNEKRVSEVMRAISSALQFVHAHQLIHADVRPENILFADEQGYVPKLINFGSAVRLGSKQLGSFAVPYASPERLGIAAGLLKPERLTAKSDVFSLGIILYMMLTGRHPFGKLSDDPEQMALSICNDEVDFSMFSGDAGNLLNGMLQKDPDQRSSIAIVTNHRFCEGIAPLPKLRLKKNKTALNSSWSIETTGSLQQIEVPKRRARKRERSPDYTRHSDRTDYVSATAGDNNTPPAVRSTIAARSNITAENLSPTLVRKGVSDTCSYTQNYDATAVTNSEQSDLQPSVKRCKL